MIPYGRQEITEDDIDAVVDVLRSDFLTQGPVVPKFECAVAEMAAARHAVAVNSATSALHIACLALGLGPGGRLWTVPNTFVASANCGRYCGAEIDFVDIDPQTWNISIAALREKLDTADRDDCLPDILLPVHFAGQPTEQEAIWDLATKYGFKVLEDASHAIGASRNGEPVGSCRWSDVTIFSFHPVKIMTSGEGGIALTNDAELADRMSLLRSHGITRDADRFTGDDNPESWYYEQQLLGFNYRMTDIHAASGLSQLGRVSGNVDRRNVLAMRYDEEFADLRLHIPTIQSGHRSAFHLYVVRLPVNHGSELRSCVFNAMRRQGIGVNVHYLPVHLQPYYHNLGFTSGDFPHAEEHAKRGLTLPLYPALSEQQQDTVINSLRSHL